jgi:hypothetical protein
MFEVENHGSIFLFRPMTDEAKKHALEVFADAQRFGGAIAIEPRCVDNAIECLEEDGFEVA